MDLLKNYACFFVTIFHQLNKFSFLASLSSPGEKGLNEADYSRLVEELHPFLEVLGGQCAALGIEGIPNQIEALNRYLTSSDATARASALERVHVLAESFTASLEGRMFLYVKNPALFGQIEPFGAAVHANFSKASEDIREAGKCMALYRFTAAVFHLMCVLEVGLDSLAHALSLPYSEKNWHVILQEIEKAVAALSGKYPKDERQFYSQAVMEFRFFKDAWRNYMAHGRAIFTEEGAKLIYDHVKAFMEHLARLQERP